MNHDIFNLLVPFLHALTAWNLGGSEIVDKIVFRFLVTRNIGMNFLLTQMILVLVSLVSVLKSDLSLLYALWSQSKLLLSTYLVGVGQDRRRFSLLSPSHEISSLIPTLLVPLHSSFLSGMPLPTTTLLPNSKSRPSKLHRRNIPFLSSFSSHSSKTYIAVSVVCGLTALVSIGFAITLLLRPPRIVTVYRFGRAEDTLRTFRSNRDQDLAGVVARPKMLGVVGVLTGFDSAERRTALRNTWFPSNPDSLISLEHATGLAFRFVIGKIKDSNKMSEVVKEEAVHHDFMMIDYDEDDNLKPAYKTMAFLKAAFNLFEADFYVKMNDAVYLRPDRLAALLAKERTHPLTYIGCMKNGPVIKDSSMKWYESQGHLIGNEYFLHGCGAIYALSKEVVLILATTKSERLRMFTNEDVAVGAWMLGMNVTHEDNTALCHIQCKPTSIAVWDFPKCPGLCTPQKSLNELHNKTSCNKTPTIPLDKDEDVY